jgi:hypothetical protein
VLREVGEGETSRAAEVGAEVARQLLARGAGKILAELG